MIEALLESSLSGFKATHILDVGPGYSNFSRIAATITEATHVTYLDCDNAVLDWQVAQSVNRHLVAEGKYAILDHCTLAALDGPFDIILCQEVLEHITQAEEILCSLTKLLSTGGLMVITVPTKSSERWLKLINSNYMKNEVFGHVREFDEPALRNMLDNAGLKPLVLLPTQPHYFVAHTWLFGSRMKVEGSTGRIMSKGFRLAVFNLLCGYSRKFFLATGPHFWGRIFPRNYFVLASRADENTH